MSLSFFIIENQQQTTQEKDLTNSEKCQRDPDLRKKFEEHMCDQLSKDKKCKLPFRYQTERMLIFAPKRRTQLRPVEASS